MPKGIYVRTKWHKKILSKAGKGKHFKWNHPMSDIEKENISERMKGNKYVLGKRWKNKHPRSLKARKKQSKIMTGKRWKCKHPKTIEQKENMRKAKKKYAQTPKGKKQLKKFREARWNITEINMNRFCKKCVHSCKQSKNCEVLECAMFERIKKNNRIMKSGFFSS